MGRKDSEEANLPPGPRAPGALTHPAPKASPFHGIKRKLWGDESTILMETAPGVGAPSLR